MLRRRNIMTERGVFTADRRLSAIDVVPERGITFSKQDASNLAQAKAANYCGQLIVMRTAGVEPADIERLYLAGGFATYLDVRNAVDIGLIAPAPEERVVKAGNAAIDGARALLLDPVEAAEGGRRSQADHPHRAGDHPPTFSISSWRATSSSRCRPPCRPRRNPPPPPRSWWAHEPAPLHRGR